MRYFLLLILFGLFFVGLPFEMGRMKNKIKNKGPVISQQGVYCDCWNLTNLHVGMAKYDLESRYGNFLSEPIKVEGEKDVIEMSFPVSVKFFEKGEKRNFEFQIGANGRIKTVDFSKAKTWEDVLSSRQTSSIGSQEMKWIFYFQPDTQSVLRVVGDFFYPPGRLVLHP